MRTTIYTHTGNTDIGRICFHERLAAWIHILPEEYAPFVPWATEDVASAIDALLSRGEVPKEQNVSHDETEIISPVAMWTAQVLYDCTRDHVKGVGPDHHDTVCRMCMERSKRKVVSPWTATLACSTAHKLANQKGTRTHSLDCTAGVFRLFSVDA